MICKGEILSVKSDKLLDCARDSSKDRAWRKWQCSEMRQHKDSNFRATISSKKNSCVQPLPVNPSYFLHPTFSLIGYYKIELYCPITLLVSSGTFKVSFPRKHKLQ